MIINLITTIKSETLWVKRLFYAQGIAECINLINAQMSTLRCDLWAICFIIHVRIMYCENETAFFRGLKRKQVSINVFVICCN